MTLVIDDLRIGDSGDAREASFRTRCRTGPERIWFRLPRELPPPSPDGLGACATAAALPIAMQRGEPLEIRGAACGRLQNGVERFQSVFRLFDWKLRRVPVRLERWVETPAPSAPGGMGHLLSGAVGRMLVAASFSYRDLPAWGSHPLLDPAWSTSRLEIVHDGCEWSRVEKAAVVGKSDAAMEALRVCLENREGRYNCGTCAKCLRTLVNFRNAGMLDRCRTFHRPLDLARVRRCGPPTAIERIFLVENLQAARARGDDPELLRALTIALEGDGSRVRRRARRVESGIRKLGRRAGLAG